MEGTSETLADKAALLSYFGEAVANAKPVLDVIDDDGLAAPIRAGKSVGR